MDRSHAIVTILRRHCKPTLESLRRAYDLLKIKHGAGATIFIDDLRRESGVELKPLLDLLVREAKAGNVTLGLYNGIQPSQKEAAIPSQREGMVTVYFRNGLQ